MSALPDPEALVRGLAEQMRDRISKDAGLVGIFTGRTVRAALNELYDFGRPGAVRLAVLADRGGRQLPVAADFMGAQVDVGPDEELVLSNENGKLRFAAVKRPD